MLRISSLMVNYWNKKKTKPMIFTYRFSLLLFLNFRLRSVFVISSFFFIAAAVQKFIISFIFLHILFIYDFQCKKLFLSWLLQIFAIILEEYFLHFTHFTKKKILDENIINKNPANQSADTTELSAVTHLTLDAVATFLYAKKLCTI